MFDEKLSAQFERLRAEHAGALYRHYTLTREVEKVKEDLTRMEASLHELERVRKEWEASKVAEAQAKETDND